MQTYALARIAAIPLLILAWSQAACAADSPASTTCKDGTTSTATGRGACSSHGGVQKSAPAANSSGASSSSAPAAAPASGPSAPASPPAASEPAGATAKCTDGTYSQAKTH